MSGITLIVFGSFIAILAGTGFTYFYWIHAKNHETQPQKGRFIVNLIGLTLIPIILWCWMVLALLVQNRSISGIKSMVAPLFAINLLSFSPVWLRTPHRNPLQCKHVCLLLTATLALSASTAMIQEGRVRRGKMVNFQGYSVQVVGWEALNDTYSSVRVQFENCETDIVTNCTWFDQSLQRQSSIRDDQTPEAEHHGWFQYSDGREFTCTGGPVYTDDDGTSDWPVAYNVDGNTYACEAHWRLSTYWKSEGYKAPYGVDDRYASKIGVFFGFAAMFALGALMEYFGWQPTVNDDRDSPFLEDSAPQAVNGTLA